MALSFGNSAGAAPAGVNVQTGPDLEDIQTEAIYFRALSGSSKVQLLPTAWPTDQLPPPTSSLMSVASQQGLVAAAGPDVVILATTESVRKAFEGAEVGDGGSKPFQPQLRLPMPMRISQLAFSADEKYLVLSAETGGGLAVYEVQALLQGNTNSAFQIATEQLSLRALIPNPTPEKGELFALVTNDGKLMMANLKEKNFISGSNGPVLKDGVSCISWSAKGKQLVAGLGDGTAYQMTPEGEGKAIIPRPPTVDTGDHVSSITWLENHVFLMVHTPSQYDTSQPPQSSFNIVTRQQQQPSNFTFQKIADPAGPFGLNRSPPHHFLLRLRDFPPNLQDLIVVASTASADIGLFSRSKVPLTADKPAEKVTGVFTMTEMSDDSRRAALPMAADLSDTSPIGLVMDLSSKEKVEKPIPGDEMDESPSPVPALMVLNNEGVLAAWWVIYVDSVRQNTVYPGLVAAGGSQTTQKTPAPAPATPTAAFGAPAQPAFGSSAFGSSNNAFAAARPATSFGSPSLPGASSSTFGSPSLPGASTGAFGAPSGLGKSQSPWGASATTNTTPSSGPTFGSSTFGSTPAVPKLAFGAPSFGATSTPALGNRASVWATGGGTGPTASFGQAGGLGKPAGVFGTPANSGNAASASSGFAAFASKGGFGAAAAAAPSGAGSIFGSQPASAANPFASSNTNTPFGSTPTTKPASTFGSSGFVFESSFKADPSAKDDPPEPSNQGAGSFFGGNFGSALGEAAKAPAAETPVSKEADMDTDETTNKEETTKPSSTTPISTPAAPKTSIFGSATPTSNNLFGSTPTTSTAASKPVSAGFSFGQPSSDKPKPSNLGFGNLAASGTPEPKTPSLGDSQASAPFPKTPLSPKIKQEPVTDTPLVSNKIPEAPLPPDATSKSSFTAGESSGSSVAADAPLPPDFLPRAKPKEVHAAPPSAPELKPIPAELIPPCDVPGGPDDDGDDSGFLTEEGDQSEDASEELSGEGSEEGSGEDVTKDLSPTSENNQTPVLSPESSFGGFKTRSPESNTFTKISKPGQSSQHRSALFGEGSAPVLLPPKIQASPRSPSPVRNAIPGRLHRPDAPRSSSAPGFASQLLGSQRMSGRPPAPTQNTLAQTQEELQQEERRRQEIRARKEAEEKQALVDEDDEKFHQFMTSEVEPTKKLATLQAHADYDGKSSMESIPAQVEAVYRDINSMIDTLGMNARNLKGFIKGHTEQYKEEGRTRADLEQEEDWCLVEVEDLSSLVERDLTKALEAGRVRDIKTKLEICGTLQKDLNKLRTKYDDVKRIVDTQRDPDFVAVSRAQPLSAEQAAQQTDLRRDFTKFQKLLSEAEESLSVLKAKTVSQTTNGKNAGSAGPTVEAVMRTITKMTTMAERRSGDIDVLEGQMRKLRFGSVGSREGSPFATPQNNRASTRNLGASSLFYTPESIKESQHRFQSSLMSSVGSHGRGSPPRKKLSGYTGEEKVQLRTKLARKKEVTDRLKEALKKNGTNVRLMVDEE